MFYCQLNKHTSKANESPVKVVIETRPKTYENIVNKKIKISYGEEIVKEVIICKDCYKQLEQQNGA